MDPGTPRWLSGVFLPPMPNQNHPAHHVFYRGDEERPFVRRMAVLPPSPRIRFVVDEGGFQVFRCLRSSTSHSPPFGRGERRDARSSDTICTLPIRPLFHPYRFFERRRGGRLGRKCWLTLHFLSCKICCTGFPIFRCLRFPYPRSSTFWKVRKRVFRCLLLHLSTLSSPTFPYSLHTNVILSEMKITNNRS